jgi:hypothetical protein
MKWISVKNSLPKESRDHKVLICRPIFEKGYEYVNFCDYYIAYLYNNKWVLGTGGTPEFSLEEYCYWMTLTQPERSKREDLDCNCDDLEYLYNRYETYVAEHDQKSSDIIKSLLNKSKMRCSEHCGNTVRDK